MLRVPSVLMFNLYSGKKRTATGEYKTAYRFLDISVIRFDGKLKFTVNKSSASAVFQTRNGSSQAPQNGFLFFFFLFRAKNIR